MVTKVNLDLDFTKEGECENLSDSDSNVSEEDNAQNIIEHKRFKSVNLPHNATVGQYSSIQSSNDFKKEK